MQGPKWPIILLSCGPGVVIVKYWDRLPCDWDRLYFGYSSPYKGDSSRFSLVVSGYPTSTSIPWVDELSTDTSVLGCHSSPCQGKIISGTEGSPRDGTHPRS